MKVTDEQVLAVYRLIKNAETLEALSNEELGKLLLDEVWVHKRLGSREELILSECISRLAPSLDTERESEASE